MAYFLDLGMAGNHKNVTVHGWPAQFRIQLILFQIAAFDEISHRPGNNYFGKRLGSAEIVTGQGITIMAKDPFLQK